MFPCKGEVERNVVWLEVMEEEESTEMSESFQWKFTLLTQKKKIDSRTRLHSPHPTFVFYSFQFLSLHFHICLACLYGKAFSLLHLSLNLHTHTTTTTKKLFLQFVFAGSEFSTHWWQSCFVKVVFSLPSFILRV